MQLFCGILLKPSERIKDVNLPDWWRTYIGRHLNTDAMHKAFADYWKPYMHRTAVGMQDATFYESRISFPTDVKLLWECCHTTYQMIQAQKVIEATQEPHELPASKIKLSILPKSRKKTRRAEKKLRKKLLKFLIKLTQNLDELKGLRLSNEQQIKLKHIKKIYEQQHERLYGNKPVKDRIVSLSKPYIRTIVRGKEVKKVEFGVKVNVLQVDGINFIEHISYDAFNEGTRLISGIDLQCTLFSKYTYQSADQIYATYANRSYFTPIKFPTTLLPKANKSYCM